MRSFGIPLENFQTEIIYSFVIIFCSLMIYFGTRELYELSSYKGIKYLRKSFLFFAIAFFFRSFIKIFFILTKNHTKIMISQSLGLFIFIYFSSMAIFYLIYSMMWKKWNEKSKRIYILHTLALIISTISILFNSAKIYLIINIIIFLLILLTLYYVYNKSKKKHQIYVIYVLLSIFWILNVMDILIPKFLQTFQLIIYLASISIFITILYKVTKKAGSN
jgi:hypothetical protein